MATHPITASRLVLAGGFALAALAAPAMAALATSDAPGASACPGGETQDMFTNTCSPDLVPNSPGSPNAPSPYSTIPGNPDMPAIDGIPCAGHNSGQCVGLAEEQQAQTPLVQPHTSVSSSP